MIRERLKEVDIKITELADYLHITRPTLYKFIESYDNNEYDTINKKVIKLFKYIEGNPLAGKNSIINYILNNLVIEKEMGELDDITRFSKIKKFTLENPSSTKSKFIDYIISKKDFDLTIDYLIKIIPLLKKRRLSNKEIELLKPYDTFINEISKEDL